MTLCGNNPRGAADDNNADTTPDQDVGEVHAVAFMAFLKSLPNVIITDVNLATMSLSSPTVAKNKNKYVD